MTGIPILHDNIRDSGSTLKARYDDIVVVHHMLEGPSPLSASLQFDFIP